MTKPILNQKTELNQNHQLKRLKRLKRGFSLIELMMVFGLIGIAVASAFIALSGATAKQKTLDATKNVTYITTKIKSLYNRDYSTLTTQVGIDGRAFPSSLVSGTKVINVWGGAIVLAPGSINGGTNNAYALTYGDVPKEECVGLVKATATNFTEIDINGATVKSNALPLTTATIVTTCIDPVNVIVWRD